jgi:hypothetical protein
MNPIVQSGMHPDAESLTAFAEQLLPAAERDQILAHMARCGRCREVVFLTQHAASEDQQAPVVGSAATPGKLRGSWFNGWKWMWIPATAFAGLIGVAVVQHFRHAASETQMTARLSQTDALSTAEPAKAPAKSPRSIPPTRELQKAKTANPSETRDQVRNSAPLPAAKDKAKQLDEKKSVERRQLAVGSAGPPIVIPPGLSGGSIYGMVAARANGSPIGGPVAANQFQQQNMTQQNTAQQNALQQSRSVAADAANKPLIAGAAPASASQTVTVQADTVEMSAAPAPAPPPQVSSIPLTGQSYEVSSAEIAGLSKAQKITLPNGLGTLSVASEAGRSIALDTAGAMFLSEDTGKHWQPIHTQWTGRAILVRTWPVGTEGTALRAMQTMRFELVNDKLQTWISYDGKTWTQQVIPLQ